MYSASPEPYPTAGRTQPIVTECSADLPTNALMLMNAVQERRIELMGEGRYGEVRTVDIPTDENGNPIRLRPAGEQAVPENE
jgi:hypothetical protein